MSKYLSLLCFLCFSLLSTAQDQKKDPFADDAFKGLKLRSLGPAFMSGRIADIAIHPDDDSVWYVAVGSGGVWKTQNAGVTWTPIFDGQSVYSIGCISIDPNNPHIIWVGTGENVGGRHVGYGDGVYRSDDGGKSWKNMGLKKSEHISKIIVHPNNSNTIWVAAQGPLWNKGGERGLYQSTDGGKTWTRQLGDEEWTGVTDLLIDPRNPDHLYAATWQRHRNVAAYMGGGPGSGIHRTTDGGKTWEKLSSGLPSSNMGKIGLAISPQQPDVLYAAIELDRRTGGVYRSTNRGSSWEKRSDAVSGATGPHYYQELYASPHQFDRIYLVDVRMQISENGGKNFRRMKEKYKHSDNHAIAFRADDPDYLLVGTDGGLYESFDLAENWRFIDNLPVTQFYKVALDDREPFYHIYGGTQDNSTQGGPSRTDNVHGIQNSDWKIVLNWDGHQPATEPGNPDIMYAERQEGTLSRVDLSTGEVMDIQPQPAAGEDYERFNWDAPILVSPHSPTRIYFASQRVWRSDNRGDEWTAISTDLTRNQERFALPIMGNTQSWDAPWDVLAMSNYNTITSLAESPKQEGLLYAGTDDGIIQVSEDGGNNWRKIEAGSINGIPATAFVNDIKADLFDVNTVYAALDNHKYGDFTPYLIKSKDRGKTWTSIRGNLPDRTLVWRMVQDHEQANLLFAGTEFGLYFSIDGGQKWTKLKGGMPTISVRDLAIQRRENDLVLATFGRGFYVLDDYSLLRELSAQQMEAPATLFTSRKAWWYIPRPDIGFSGPRGSMGASHFVAPNPPFGAVFSYYLKEGSKTQKSQRTEKEKELAKDKKDIPFPGWETINAEAAEMEPKIWLTVKDNQGNVVRRIKGAASKGFHRVAWDLHYPAPNAIRLNAPNVQRDFQPRGMLAPPGTYTVSMAREVNGIISELSTPQSFEVVPLRQGALKGASPDELAKFWRSYEEAVSQSSSTRLSLGNAKKKVKAMYTALERSTAVPGPLDNQLHELRKELITLELALNGSPAKGQPGEKTKPTVGERMFSLYIGLSNSTYGPTKFHKEGLAIVKQELQAMQKNLAAIEEKTMQMEQSLLNNGAPPLEGTALPRNR
ncbi:MAG: glycosyl hydrolase [Bacteroidota bacterium]